MTFRIENGKFFLSPLSTFGIAFFLVFYVLVRDSASFPDFGSQGLGKLLCNVVNHSEEGLPKGPLFAFDSTPCGWEKGSGVLAVRDGNNEDMWHGSNKVKVKTFISCILQGSAALELAERDRLSQGSTRHLDLTEGIK